MTDILAVTCAATLFDELLTHCTRNKIRVKIIAEAEKIPQWLALRSFSALVLDAQLPSEVLCRAVAQMCEHNPMALCYAFSPKMLSSEQRASILASGAELLHPGSEVEQAVALLRPEYAPAMSQVLLVEDLDTPREIVQMYLEHLGFRALGVDGASAAWEELDREPTRYMCVITDIRMPEMSGVELTDRVRNDGRFAALPIIALSAYGTASLVMDALRAGISGFLAKPPKREDLVRELGRARRIAAGLEPARLVDSDNFEVVRAALVKRGFIEDSV